MRILRNLVAATVLTLGSATAIAADAAKIAVVNYPLAYFVERLTAGAAEIVYPIPAGEDPAFWRPGITDIAAIQAADMIVLNGAGFADWVARTSLPRASIVDTSKALTRGLIATETVTHSHGAGGEHSHAATASFLWLDPARAAEQASAIAEGLKRRRLADADQIDGNLAALTADLTALSDKLEGLSTLALDTRIIATHPRYQYLGDAIGLDITALEWAAGVEPSDADWAELQRLAGGAATAILIWEAEPPAAARAKARDLGFVDTVFPTLSSQPAEGDFLGSFSRSIDALEDALKTAGD